MGLCFINPCLENRHGKPARLKTVLQVLGPYICRILCSYDGTGIDLWYVFKYTIDIMVTCLRVWSHKLPNIFLRLATDYD